jgi:crossover junction endodeoxyribonuclease RuvC
VPPIDTVAAIEQVHAMPKQGVASSFKFGQSYGFLRAMLIAFGIRFESVTPGKWQRELGCLSRGRKNVTKAKAQETFPGVKCTHAISDALLLAAYARRRISCGPRLHAAGTTERNK